MLYQFKVFYEPDETAYAYWAQGVELGGCMTQGKTLADLKVNIRDAAELYLSHMTKWPKAKKVSKKYKGKMVALDIFPGVENWSAAKVAQQLGIAEQFIDQNLVLSYYLVLKFFKGRRSKANLWFSFPNPNLGSWSAKEMILLGRGSKVHNFVLQARLDITSV